MISRLDTLTTMATHGPWSVQKTIEAKYQVVSGKIVVATCDRLWDAELIVYLFGCGPHFQTIEKENASLLREVDSLSATIETMHHSSD
jgi:hypothetical protein